jgi:uncharacterized LabA/DUF88 family protein
MNSTAGPSPAAPAVPTPAVATGVPAPSADPGNAIAQTKAVARVRVFVDYWNFQLSLNALEAKLRGVGDYRFQIAWARLGPWLAAKACAVAGVPAHSFEGVIIYTSYDPSREDGKKFNQWATTKLSRFPGVQVHCRERKPRSLPRCPACHQLIANCPHCTKRIVSTVEKGVDTLVATDMIRLAWEQAYDLAVLATSDSDLVPAVEFLNLRGRKIVQAGFPPVGIDLARSCWASFNVFPDRAEIERT